MINNIKRYLILGALTVLLCALGFSVGVFANKPLAVRVGVYENPPKIFTDENGHVSGFWPDLINYIASQEDWHVEWVPGTWAQCLERLQRGKIDVMPDVALTEERSKKYRFSNEMVLPSWSEVYTREGTGVESILDLEGKKVAVLEGSVNVEGPEGIKELVKRFHVNCTFIEVDSYLKVFQLVQGKRADAGVTNKDFGAAHSEAFTLNRTAIIFQPLDIKFAFPMKSSLTPNLSETIDRHLNALKQDPHSIYYQALEEHLGTKPQRQARMLIPGWAKNLLLMAAVATLMSLTALFILRRELRRRTASLHESEARYRSIVQYQTECIDRWFPDGTLTFVNDTYCKYYGRAREELIGRSWIDTVAREDRDEVLAYVERLKKTVTPEIPVMTTEHREVLENGEVRWMQWSDVGIFSEHGALIEFQSVGRDITEHKKAQEREQALLQQQIAINKLSVALGSFTSLQDIYDTIYQSVAELIDADACYISSYDKKEQLIRAEYVRDEFGHSVDIATLPPLKLEEPGHGTQSQVIRSGKPMYIPDILQAMENIEESYNIAPDGTITKDTLPYADQEDVPRSELLAPMLFKGDVMGVIGIENTRVDAYTEADLDLLSSLANVAAVAIENTRLQEGLKKTLEDTIRVVGLTTQIRDPYTARHQERVSDLACAIARQMGLTEKRIEGLRAASLVHDIGKIAIPAEILTKPTKLSELEFRVIQEHPQVGYDILKNTDFPWPIADIVLQHHERMDGSGYPKGLKGDQILLEARILAVSDVVEAMASHRPYRPALGLDAALDEVKKNKGRLYDPDVVDACLAVFKNGFTFKQ